MTSKQRRPNAGIPGAKALIAAASMAATIAGWAAFSNANTNSYQTTPTQAVVVSQAASFSYNLPPLQLTPLPTLVPIVNIKVSSMPTAIRPVTQSSQPTTTSVAQLTETSVPPTDTAVPATDTPVPTDTPVMVVQRPRSVTTTRSSRGG